jgi:hypothetical protein
MLSKSFKYFLIAGSLILGSVATAQEPGGDPGDIRSLIEEEVELWNPVYKPVIGLGVGTFNYFGEVRNSIQHPFNGEMGYKLNVSTFIDNKHFVRGNFYLLTGNLSGNERNYNDSLVNGVYNNNINFKANMYTFGINVNYDFDHFILPQRSLRPFISVGLEIITFNSKTDLSYVANGEEVQYHYWPDGSLRNGDLATTPDADLVFRDYKYESNLNDAYDFGLDNYPQYTLAIPIDLGLDYQITDRVMFRIGSSLHYTLSDEIDHVSKSNTHARIGDDFNDFFTFSYFSLHLDLFSSKKSITVSKYFAMQEWDNTLMGDEDADGVFDRVDECPGTPFGVDVDTAGCPFDSDLDGITDYLDDEPNSRYGALVDERGVEMTDDDIIASLDMSKAVSRSDISMYIRTPDSYNNYKKMTSKEIPEKFINIDIDNDGYISYEEMMNTIDEFFEFESNLTSDDIYELNDFFFSQ